MMLALSGKKSSFFSWTSMQAQMHYQASCRLMERALPQKVANMDDTSVERQREENCVLITSGVHISRSCSIKTKETA